MSKTFEASVLFEGHITRFLLTSRVDEVQNPPARGQFYQLNHLIAHRQLIPVEGMGVVDIGAGIGNHALFYSAHSSAQRIFCFEPNPAALEMLRNNIALNQDTKIDLTYAHFACSDKSGRCRIFPNPTNLGGTRLVPEADDQSTDWVSTVTLDSILLDEIISFIKIDVEGMEMAVLRGAQNIIDRLRPALAVEVFNENIEQFWQWADTNQYHIVYAFRDYWDSVDYVCVAKRAPAVSAQADAEGQRYWKAELQRRKESPT